MVSFLALTLILLSSLSPVPLAVGVSAPVVAYVVANGGAGAPSKPGTASPASISPPAPSPEASGAPAPCDAPGTAVPQGRKIVQSGETLYLCEGSTPLVLLPGVRQFAVDLIDDDGFPDLLVNWKPKPDAPLRLHVYGLNDGILPPIWRGSRMSAELESFALVPRKDAPAMVVTLEKVGKVQRWVGHRWNKFGFVSICSASVDAKGAGVLKGCAEMTVRCETTEGFPICSEAK